MVLALHPTRLTRFVEEWWWPPVKLSNTRAPLTPLLKSWRMRVPSLSSRVLVLTFSVQLLALVCLLVMTSCRWSCSERSMDLVALNYQFSPLISPLALGMVMKNLWVLSEKLSRRIFSLGIIQFLQGVTPRTRFAFSDDFFDPIKKTDSLEWFKRQYHSLEFQFFLYS